MNKELKTKMCNVLNAEFDYVKRTETDKSKRLEKFLDIKHFLQIIENFEELEPVIADYINKKADRTRFDR